MPVYEYACIACDIDYAFTRSIHDKEPDYFCEKCGNRIIRCFNPVGVTFKGNGFYKTDNRK